MPEFLPGLELSRRFYGEAVRPILEADFPDLPYSAALIGTGSEVLGFDTEMSSDHDWGPRLLLFLNEDDHARHAETLRQTLRRRLPAQFLGYSTRFTPPAPQDNGTPLRAAAEKDIIYHRVLIWTLRGFFRDYLQFDLDNAIEPADWLTFPEQKLRALVAGAVYHDAVGLQAVRNRFAYYPRDVWLYLLAAGWTRIAQEEHLMGRAGYVGDEIGSALIGARLAHDLMRLCFLMERQYAPYPKWFGTAFGLLPCAADLSSHLSQALQAAAWQEREEHLCAAYACVAARHNALHITEPLPTEPTSFFTRPFRVIHLGGGFADAIRAQITDPEVQRIAAGRLIGSLDQFSDSTDILSDSRWRPTLRRLYTDR